MDRVEYKVEYIGEGINYKPYIITKPMHGVVASFYMEEVAKRVCDELNAREILKNKETKQYPKLRDNNDKESEEY